MLVSVEISTNPGPSALFVAEARIEKGAVVNPRSMWWGIWLGWWLFPLRDWETWLWAFEVVNEGRWRTLLCRVAGFELNLQLWLEECHGK